MGKNEKGQKKHKQKQTSRPLGPLSAPFLLSALDAPTGFRLFLSPGQGRPAVKKKIRETHHLFNNTHFMISFSYLLATLYFTESSDSGVIIAINEREGTKCGHSYISRIGTHSLPCECQPLKREVPVSSLVMEL